jgi:KUP system potassium uptake protein
MVMYIWYYARKINNRFTKFEELGKHSSLLTELSQDYTIPKFATHLIYLTKADRRHEIEDKVIKSIFAKTKTR